MTEVISVKFKNRGKSYYFSPNGKSVKTGQQVIVETSKGLEIADCSRGNHEVEDDAVIQPLRPVVRLATRDDLRVAEINKQREKEAFEICRQKIAEHGLDMKLVDVECNFEGNKTMFFFTSDGRVDFRELVKDLAGIFRNRIELRQIGVRDEAKMLGGIGICGRPFCCNQFIDEFQPVSTKMAKMQSMSLNPGKISGSCGRLMCCLRYEQEAYEELTKNVPKQGAFVETPSGYGVVTQVNLLRQMVKVKLDGDGDDTVKTYRAVEVAAVPGGRPKDGETPPSVLKYIPEPEEEEEEEDEWKLPELFASDSGVSAQEGTAEQKKRSRRRSRRGGGKKPNGDAKPKAQPEKASPAQEDKTPTAKPKPRNNRRGGGKKPAEQKPAEQQRPQQAKGPDAEKKRSNRRYYHRGKPKNKGDQTQNQ
ncbi:MAG: stage 0 sporulation family protein [Oscillospiraceae bacterium]|nr:stage 0 sporulation family protein [Oscillospiraceae bacterium]